MTSGILSPKPRKPRSSRSDTAIPRTFGIETMAPFRQPWVLPPTVKTTNYLAFAVAIPALLTGCATNTESRVSNPSAPGPAVGNAVGTAVGAVGSNVVGVAVGAAEGAATATKATFTNERRVIRVWKTETTSDGRTIQVPVEIEVDENGRPIEKK